MPVLTEKQHLPHKIDSAKDRWRTPQWAFLAGQRLAHVKATVDVACDETNCLCPNGLTVARDALSCDWGEAGVVCWCNPPYSNCGVWVRKVLEQQKRGVTVLMLLPQSLDTQWYANAKPHCQTLLVVGKRIQFETANLHDGEDAVKKSANTGGSMFLLFRGCHEVDPFRGQIQGISFRELYNLGIA